MMEKSSTFISLSGLSGVFAGCMALIGSVLAYRTLHRSGISYFSIDGRVFSEDIVLELFLIAMGVLIFSLIGGIFFTVQKSKRKNLKIWNKVTRKVLIHLAIPLFAGGVFILAMLQQGILGFVAPATLVFYGLALVNASKFTYGDIRWLGYFEIVLGLISAFFIGYGLIFWAIGFGVLHIIYGTLMFNKYDRK